MIFHPNWNKDNVVITPLIDLYCEKVLGINKPMFTIGNKAKKTKNEKSNRVSKEDNT